MFNMAQFSDNQAALVLSGTKLVDATENMKKCFEVGCCVQTSANDSMNGVIDLAFRHRGDSLISSFSSVDGFCSGRWISMGEHDLLILESDAGVNIGNYLALQSLLSEKSDNMFSVLPAFDVETRELKYVELLLNTTLERLKGINLDNLFSNNRCKALYEELLIQGFHASIAMHKVMIAKHGQTMPVSINVFASQIEDSTLLNSLLDDAIEELGVEGAQFIIEVVEHEKPGNMIHFKKGIDQLRSRGFCVALDDFTHGHSGLDWVYRLDVDIIKLDMRVTQSFLKGCDSNGFIQNFIDWSNENDVEIVAEGVESTTQLKELKKLGFHTLQGFLLSGKIPVREFPNKLGL